MRGYVLGAVAWAAVLLACGARTDPGGRRADDGGVADASPDAPRRDGDAGAACCSAAMNEAFSPVPSCFQGSTYIAFAVTPPCDVPAARIEIRTKPVAMAVLDGDGVEPGAVLFAPAKPYAPQPGWSAIDTPLVLKGGKRYFVLIGTDHQAPGVGCDYGAAGDDTEYWGGELQGPWFGPFYAPYVVRLAARCD